jgi:hypothetical protein
VEPGSCLEPGESKPPKSISPRSVLILSFYLRVHLPSGIFRLDFGTKMLYSIIISPMRATCPTHLIVLDFIVLWYEFNMAVFRMATTDGLFSVPWSNYRFQKGVGPFLHWSADVQLHVDGVRLRLWSAASNGPVVIHKNGETLFDDNVDRGNLLIRAIALSVPYQQRHLVANEEEHGEEMLTFCYEVSLSYC